MSRKVEVRDCLFHGARTISIHRSAAAAIRALRRARQAYGECMALPGLVWACAPLPVRGRDHWSARSSDPDQEILIDPSDPQVVAYLARIMQE